MSRTYLNTLFTIFIAFKSFIAFICFAPDSWQNIYVVVVEDAEVDALLSLAKVDIFANCSLVQ